MLSINIMEGRNKLCAYIFYDTQKKREVEKEKEAVTRTILKMKKKQPSSVDITSVFNEKDIKITIDSIFSRFRAWSKLTINSAHLQYVSILTGSFEYGHNPDSLWASDAGWTPRTGSQPSLSCWSVDYSEKFYLETWLIWVSQHLDFQVWLTV